MARDDFWLAVSRFMQELEIALEGDNSRLVDLFDARHARKVLAAFGTAFGALPQADQEWTKDEHAFLDQAVAGLAQEGKVVCVRLALFAEMVKGKPWTPATLREVGGIEGVGVSFLEETFAASTAPPAHRVHQKAAQAVLKALLPEAGTDIKGHMRSQQELLAASGYGSRPKDFNDLLRILDSEIRLITPTDPEEVGHEPTDEEGQARLPVLRSEPPLVGQAAVPVPASPTRYHQLTHDYLVPSLRDWLTRKQKETRRGRAELLLADRAAVWNARPENRQLPSLLQWLQVRRLTRRKNWTAPQRRMMGRATRYHAVRCLVAALLLALAGWGAFEGYGWMQAEKLVGSIMSAETAEVPRLVEQLAPYHRWADGRLRRHLREAPEDSKERLHASLALAGVDAGQVEYLYGRLLDAEAHEVAVIRQALVDHKEELLERLWKVVEQPERGREGQRLRAACGLAAFDPDNPRWANSAGPVVQQLVAVSPVFLERWMAALRDIRERLRGPLVAAFRDRREERAGERSLAASILADYAADQPELLADLLMDAEATQFAVLYPKLQTHGDRALTLLRAEVARKLPPDAKNDAKEQLAKRQANAAVALLRMNDPETVWPLLKHSPDPRARSYLVHRFRPLGADAGALLKRLDEEADVTSRRALILSVGEFAEEAWPSGERSVLLEKMKDVYRTAEDPGLHASAEWLLRQWRQEEWLRETNAAWAKDRVKGEGWWVEGENKASGHPPPTTPGWYVNPQGQTMVVIPGPVEFVMGSPPTEEGRSAYESQHRKRIVRSFAIAAKPVTKEEFLAFLPEFGHDQMKRYPEPSCPIGGVSWYEAAAYCNWLSKHEGIAEDQWCYETDSKGRVTKMKEKYLSLRGYRLPTEAEWEYACRAGAVTSRYYGESDELLGKYGWYLWNSADRTWPVGSKKPNDLGLFDMHGNVWNWCQERYREYPQGEKEGYEDNEDVLTINSQEGRRLRGGSFHDLPVYVRSAYRGRNAPATRDVLIGFRAARTSTAE
jgi:formylglycine-generating enzyme required for sulfatase activity